MTPLCKVEMTPPSALGGPAPPLGKTDFRQVTKCRGGSGGDGPGFLGPSMRQVLWESLGRTVHLIEMVDQEIREIRVKRGRMVKIRFVPAATRAPFILNLMS